MERTTKLKGEPTELGGKEIKVGDKLPSFTLTGTDMKDIDEKFLAGKVGVIVTVPSLDTPVCATETKRFNEEASKLGDEVRVLIVSRDLPFAIKRFCGTEGIENAFTASDYKHRVVGEAFGVHLKSLDLLSRAVFVTDKDGTIRHVEYVEEVGSEPNYEKVLKVAQELTN